MSATSKRDRALRDGVEPVTGKHMMPAPKKKAKKKAKKKVTSNG